jgi:lipoprotein-anchoring transpeptidase ErfK/SrfK
LFKLPPLPERLRRAGPYGLTLLAGLVAGALAGAHFAPRPARVTEQQQLGATVHTDSKAATRVVAQLQTQQVTRRATRAHVRTERRLDGTVVTERIVDRLEVADTRQKIEHHDTHELEQHQTQQLEQRTLRVLEYRRDWRAGVGVGGDLQNPFRNAGNPFSSIAYGVHAEWRPVGPFWVGLHFSAAVPFDRPRLLLTGALEF